MVHKLHMNELGKIALSNGVNVSIRIGVSSGPRQPACRRKVPGATAEGMAAAPR